MRPQAPAAPAPLGLVTGHNSPRQGRLSLAFGGTLAKLSGVDPFWRPPSCTRGRVLGFSRNSRSRLIQRLASICRPLLPTLPIFWTMTYPKHWPSDPAQWKRDLDSVLKRLERKYPGVSVIWRMEAQKRGAPHFHLLIFGVRFIPRAWSDAAWRDVALGGDKWAGARACTLVKCDSWEMAAKYVSKYMAKPTHEPGQEADTALPGRQWGVRNPDGIPTEIVEIDLDAAQWWTIRRVFSKLARTRGREWGTGSIYGGGWTFANEHTQNQLIRAVGREPPQFGWQN